MWLGDVADENGDDDDGDDDGLDCDRGDGGDDAGDGDYVADGDDCGDYYHGHVGAVRGTQQQPRTDLQCMGTGGTGEPRQPGEQAEPVRGAQ